MRRLLTTVISCLALAASLAAPSVADTLQTPWQGGAAWLQRDGETLRVRFPDRSERSMPVAEEAQLRDFASFTEGSGRQRWLIAGEVRLADGGSQLWLAEGGARGSKRLEAPARLGSSSPQRHAPTLFVGAEGLAGVAWLEGGEPSSHEVWAADWLGDAFGEPYRVAAKGPGSQLALTGAVLDDGRWLLAWSAFDGKDDEIVFALRDREGWRSPTRAHDDNAVPDITPRLLATEAGALLAWSRYDGSDYRVHLASFSGEGFVDHDLPSERGSLYPRFQGSREAPLLSYRSQQPRGWTVRMLDGSGAVLRSARIESDLDERPVVVGDERAVTVAWPGEGDRLEGRVVAWTAER